MTTREQWILLICVVTLVVTLLILAILVARGGRDKQTQDTLKAIEGMRQQQSAEHSAMQAEQRGHGSALRKLLARFGFLRGGE